MLPGSRAVIRIRFSGLESIASASQTFTAASDIVRLRWFQVGSKNWGSLKYVGDPIALGPD